MGSINNISNYGIAEGHISNIKKFDNRDGSKKVLITVATPMPYKNPDGSQASAYVRTEGFVSKTAKSDGVYGIIETGDFVRVIYYAINDDWKDNNGNWHYNQVLRVQSIDLLETKAAKAARKSARNNNTDNSSADNTDNADNSGNIDDTDDFGDLPFMN